jgi:hypothetical protein
LKYLGLLGRTHGSLAWTLFWTACVASAVADPTTPVVVTQTSGLSIRVMQGEGGVNSTTSPNVVVPQILLTNAEGLPVTGATVTFTTEKPELGMFQGQTASVVARTDQRGIASAQGYKPARTGNLTISVSAEKDGNRASNVIHQRNWKNPYSALGSRGHRKWPVVAAGIGAAGAIAAYTLSGGAAGELPTATISVGQIGLGGPR